jgi:curved DNA-binding protein CbpA
LKDYYALLEIAPTSSADEVKRAFRSQIARYHPDKVQHLGKEFQAMAAERAAELTEAYRILSDDARRAEYNRVRSTAPAAGATPPPAAATTPRNPEAHHRGAPAGAAAAAEPSATKPSGAFTEERASRDEFVRKTVLGRFKQVLEATIGGQYDQSSVRGFDIACVPKPKLFGRTSGPRLLGRFVSRVDGAAVADAWTQAGKWPGPSNEEICVFLMGSGMAPLRELADAIAKQRRSSSSRGGKVILIPIDARDWDAHIPTDAPAVAKNLLAKLRGGQ